MIRLPTFDEELKHLPELSAEEKAALDEFDFDKMWREVQARLPPSERKQWVVTDMWGRKIQRFKTKAEAETSAIDRNRKAEEMGIHMRYRYTKDDGY